MEKDAVCQGLAFIVEGATEKVFYLEYLSQLCKSNELILEKNVDSQEDCYRIMSPSDNKIVMMASVNSVSQMTNSATWFHRACAGSYPKINWTVFLCYDTDEYSNDITKFHKGDWIRLRNSIEPQASKVIDMAAKADIEDVMLCDLPNILEFLGLPSEISIPSGSKGKAKLRKLYRMVAVNNAYHSGERARSLVAALDMTTIREAAPIPLDEIDKAVGVS